MKRQSAPKAAAGIALFPFLAVLLCTMGGLIVLLVVIARHAREQARNDDQAAIAARDDLEVRRADLQWRRDHLRSSRDQTAQQLADRRKVVSHVEDHIRRLRDQLTELEHASADFERQATAKKEDAAKMRAKLDELREQIRAANAETAKNEQARPKSQSYAIIPYEGPNQTRRRPIYIECRADAIVLQPEGIELIDADFFGPIGGGNPLAAGLRAAREYLTKMGSDEGDEGEPYPLLLVRPDGILAYYTAREAMRSWGTDFGYEFIDQDWKLQYKPPEAGLAVAMSRAIDEARIRQETLALAAPKLLNSRQRQAYRSAGARGAAAGASGNGTPGETAAGSSSSDQFSNGQAGGDQFSGSGYGARRARAGRRGRATSDDLAALYGGRSSGSADTGNSDASERAPEELRSGSNSPKAGGASAAASQSSAMSDATLGQPHRPATADPQMNDSASPTDVGPSMKGMETSGKAYAKSKAASNGRQGGGAGTEPPPDREEVRTPKRSLAQSRGKDWSLRGEHRSAVAVTRPIRLRCYGDHLVLLSEPGERTASQLIPLGYRTQDSVDALVDAIHARIDGWGLAGHGMYWRPTLVVEIAADGKARSADLRELLTDSGLELREKELAAQPPQQPRY